MNNIGQYDFSEQSKVFITKLAEITSQDEKFIKDALRYICLKTFNEILKDAEASVIEKIKSYAADPEMLQSYFRTQFPEYKVKEVFTNIHNSYIDGFIAECGGNYTDEILEQVKRLRF